MNTVSFRQRLRRLCVRIMRDAALLAAVVWLSGAPIPVVWRSRESQQLSATLSSLVSQGAIAESVSVFVYMTLPGERMSASVTYHGGRYTIYVSDHFLAAPSVVSRAMFAHELGHVVNGDCLVPGETDLMQTRADAFAARLVGRAAIAESLAYLGARQGFDAMQADIFELTIHDRGAEHVRKRLAALDEYLAAYPAPTP